MNEQAVENTIVFLLMRILHDDQHHTHFYQGMMKSSTIEHLQQQSMETCAASLGEQILVGFSTMH